MTKEILSEIESLKALLSEGPDHLVLAEMLGFVADRLMALDADQPCGAGKHERSSGSMLAELALWSIRLDLGRFWRDF